MLKHTNGHKYTQMIIDKYSWMIKRSDRRMIKETQTSTYKHGQLFIRSLEKIDIEANISRYQCIEDTGEHTYKHG